MKAMRIGGRLRRLRQERRLTQAQMARELGISASYLTLLESNQRPVTVPVLLKLVERFQVELERVRRRHRPAAVARTDGGVLRSDLRGRRGEGERRAGAGRNASRRRPGGPRPLRRLSPSPAGERSDQRGRGCGGRRGGDHPLRGGDRIHPAPAQLLSRTRGGRRAPVGRERPRHPHPAAGPDRTAAPALRRRCRDPRRRPDAGPARAATTSSPAPPRNLRDAAAFEPPVPDRPPDRLSRFSRPAGRDRRRGQIRERGGGAL